MIDIYSKEFKLLEKKTRQNLGVNNRVFISPEHVIDLIETIKELLEEKSSRERFYSTASIDSVKKSVEIISLNRRINKLEDENESLKKQQPELDKWFKVGV